MARSKAPNSPASNDNIHLFINLHEFSETCATLSISSSELRRLSEFKSRCLEPFPIRLPTRGQKEPTYAFHDHRQSQQGFRSRQNARRKADRLHDHFPR